MHYILCSTKNGFIAKRFIIKLGSAPKFTNPNLDSDCMGLIRSVIVWHLKTSFFLGKEPGTVFEVHLDIDYVICL